MKIVITGATGHLGRHVTHRLAGAGHTVVAASRSGAVPAAPFGRAAIEGDRVTPLRLDVGDDACVDALTPHLGPEVALVHLAAWHPPATASTTLDDRRALIETNVMGTMRVLEAARRAKIAAVVYASTFEVYGDTEGDLTEASRVRPVTDYGATKLSGENHLVSFSAEEGGVRYVALRMPAIYGPGELTSRALPNFVRAVAAGRSAAPRAARTTCTSSNRRSAPRCPPPRTPRACAPAPRRSPAGSTAPARRRSTHA